MLLLEQDERPDVPHVGAYLRRVAFGDSLGVHGPTQFSGPCFDNPHTRVVKYWWGDCEFVLPSLAFTFFVVNDYRKA